MSLTNLNKFEIMVNDTSKQNQDKHDETVDRINNHVNGHIQGMRKQILDTTLIIMAIMVSGLLGFCAVKSYVTKNSNTNLVDIQGSA